MKPIEFPEQNIVFGKDQPEYQPLPALTNGRQVISCWELDDDELKHLQSSKKIYLSVMTFGQPLQPLFMTARKSELINADDEDFVTQLIPMTGVELIAQERKEQIEKHKWDDTNNKSLIAAAKYCLDCACGIPEDRLVYPHDWDNWFYLKIREKRQRLSDKEFKIEMLQIAGAFCGAQIDVLQIKDQQEIKQIQRPANPPLTGTAVG